MCRGLRTGAVTSLTGLLIGLSVAACSPTYSPDSYASNAAQVANKVNQGVVVGVRPVMISADSTLGTATGGAAGGIAGSQVGVGATSALSALGGSLAGGLVGNVVSHAAGDTNGFEYIVRKSNGDKPNGDLISVTQKDTAPLGIGAHVLVIEGPQARIVADYTVPVVSQPLHPDPVKPAQASATPSPILPETTTAPAVTSLPLPPVGADSAPVSPAKPDEAQKPAGS